MVGRTVDGPYAALARARTSSPQRSTTSLALHLRNTSPTNSWVPPELGESGKCHGELNVSVSARCCSAITLREILWNILEASKGKLGRLAGTYRT